MRDPQPPREDRPESRRPPILKAREAGVLAHITSLPGHEGMGSLGEEAHAFVDLLAEAGQRLWQILPLNPTHGDGSPYSALSSFAGGEHVISLAVLADQGWLDRGRLEPLRRLDPRRIDFGTVLPLRRALITEAARNFLDRADHDARALLAGFEARSRHWLDDYALFRALLEVHDWADWTTWPAGLRDRDGDALAAARTEYQARIALIRVQQYFFDSQWQALRAHAARRNVALFGDIPIYAAQTSADVWCAPWLFDLDETGKPLSVAGCPPDMMAAAGQRWGNPTYDWAAMERDGFAWWIARLRHTLDNYDLVRIDHFRAFASYWRIPAEHADAVQGRWVEAPGEKLFTALEREFGHLPFVAEDLGFITPDVYALRDQFGLPGMHIIQYELEAEPLAPEAAPGAFRANSTAYFGNHDNETAMGWLLRQRDTLTAGEIARRPIMRDALHAIEPHWALNRLTLAAGSDLAILQMQDMIGLDGSHRMNVPGTIGGNWAWRFQWADAPLAVWQRLARETADSGRAPSRGEVPEVLAPFLREVETEFLARQHPVTGLMPAGPAHNSHGDYSHAWVRDNCYCMLAIRACAAACRRAGLEQRACALDARAGRLMRGLLAAMKRQEARVLRFLETGDPADALHAKFDMATGDTVSGDHDWGHLQFDATALFLLLSVDAAASGLTVLSDPSDARFLLLLRDYVALAWRRGDFGTWERGDKRNNGRVERHSSSMGLVRAALLALNHASFRLADGRGWSPPRLDPQIHRLFEEALAGALPEESAGKEIDAGLLAIIGFPGYATRDDAMDREIRQRMGEVLWGPYGAVRFLRDGHQSPLEVRERLHYEAGELAGFAGLECQWPLFFAFEALDSAMAGDASGAAAWIKRLEAACVPASEGEWLRVPELYALDRDSVSAERAAPHSQDRRPNDNIPLYWGQSLYLCARLLLAGLITPGDLDPTGRRDRASVTPPANVPVPALQLLLARGLWLRPPGPGRGWCHALTPGVLDDGDLGRVPEEFLAALVENPRIREDRSVIGLDLGPLMAGGRTLLQRSGSEPSLAMVTGSEADGNAIKDWRQWRRDRGALLAVGGAFSEGVHSALARCAGIRVSAGAAIDSRLARADHTPRERAFALLLLQGLGSEDELAARSLAIETLAMFCASDLVLAGMLDPASLVAACGGVEALADRPARDVRARLAKALAQMA